MIGDIIDAEEQDNWAEVLDYLEHCESNLGKSVAPRQYTLVTKLLPPNNYGGELTTCSKKMTYTLSEELFDKINIDESRCKSYSKDSHMIKLTIQCGSPDAFRDFDRHIKRLLEFIEGRGADPASFAPKNQFEFMYLAELFQCVELKNIIVNLMSHNVDKNEVFEFLRIASLDAQNQVA